MGSYCGIEIPKAYVSMYVPSTDEARRNGKKHEEGYECCICGDVFPEKELGVLNSRPAQFICDRCYEFHYESPRLDKMGEWE